MVGRWLPNLTKEPFVAGGARCQQQEQLGLRRVEPEAVGHAAGNERESARSRLDRILPDDQRHFSVDDVEAFLLPLMEVVRGREAGPAIDLDQRVSVAVL